jgi:hypothetical protein
MNDSSGAKKSGGPLSMKTQLIVGLVTGILGTAGALRPPQITPTIAIVSAITVVAVLIATQRYSKKQRAK